MITEDYVSFEVAKLLKEKGFDEPVNCFYFINGTFSNNTFDTKNSYTRHYAAPTFHMTMKWLRDVHKIIPIILTGGDSVTPFYYWFRIDKINNGKWEDSIYRDETEHNTYEEACEVAIKYCLENLI